MTDSVAGLMRADPLAVTMLEDPFDASLDYPPYPGLRPFFSIEWPIFFGRETMTDEIIDLVTKQHLVVVHGDSGSGKSSIVRAGVLVQLQQGHAATDASWRTCAMLPREDALGNLARALAALLAADPTPDQILDVRHILNRGRRAPETLSQILRGGESDHICILVDQFEELFSFAKRRSPEETRLLVDLLVGLQQNPPPGLYAILTMRSEFLGHCARFEGLAEAVNRTQYLLPRMDRPALLRAICDPATLYGGEVSLELAERLIADAGGGQDQLPLIQHGLMRLWRRKVGPPRELAEAAGARTRVESAIRDRRAGAGIPPGRWSGLAARPRGLSGCRRPHHAAVGPRRSGHGGRSPRFRPSKIVEHLFRALTDINAEGQAIRRPQTFAELMAVTGSDAPTLEAIIDHFRAEGVFFLTPFGNAPIKPGTLIDISHEALIRCWRKIADKEAGWLQREFKDGLLWRTLVIQAESFERDPASVLSPTSADERERWLQHRTAAWAKRYGGGWEGVRKLVEASVENAAEVKRREQEHLVAEEREKRQEVELQAARQLAAAEAAKRRRTVWGLVTMSALALAGLSLGTLAYWQREIAYDASRLAEVERTTAEAAKMSAEEARNDAEKARIAAESTLQQLQDQIQRANRAEASAAQVQTWAAETVASTLSGNATTEGDAITGVLDRLQQASDPYEVAVLAQSLAQSKIALSPDQAEVVLRSLIEALRQSEEPTTKSAIAQAIQALAPTLTAEQAQTALDPIFDAINATSTPSALKSLVDAVQALPAQLSDEQARVMSAALLAPRVYIQISEEMQRAPARALTQQLEQTQLDGEPVVVPGIELVSGSLSRSAVRCFRVEECQTDGRQLVDAVNGMLGTPQVVLEDLSSLYAKATNIRRRHYELWFAPGEITLRPAQAN